jgi:hypothetical protein
MVGEMLDPPDKIVIPEPKDDEVEIVAEESSIEAQRVDRNLKRQVVKRSGEGKKEVYPIMPSPTELIENEESSVELLDDKKRR